jgi:hypothetical protein
VAEETPAQDANKSAQDKAEGKSTVKKTKKTSRKKSARKKSNGQNSARKGRAPRPYPAKTLEEALAIPRAIREQNNGNPWDTEDVAQASLGGSKAEFVSNTLQKEFGLAPEFHSDFISIFKSNCKFLGIEKGLSPAHKLPKKDDALEHPSEIQVIGQPKGKFDRTAFVIMPFGEKGERPRPNGFFNELLNSLITPAANSAGFSVETARMHGSDVIQSTIINQLLKADLIIADLTDHNPNVLFELGIRIAKDLPVALIKAEGTGPIFDVDNYDEGFALQSESMANNCGKGCISAYRSHQRRLG